MKNKLKLGKIEVSNRLTIADVRRAKAVHDIDLSKTDEDSPIIRMQFDPIVVTETIFALYEDRLQQKGIKSLDDLEAAVEPEQFDDIRSSLESAVGGFFPLAKIVSTKMRETLAGSIDLAVAEVEEKVSRSGTN